MKTIYKYPLAIEDFQIIQLPKGAKILCVQAQEDQPQLWAVVDTLAAKRTDSYEPKHIITIATGGPMPDVGKYLGTYQVLKGRFVGHVFLAPAT